MAFAGCGRRRRGWIKLDLPRRFSLVIHVCCGHKSPHLSDMMISSGRSPPAMCSDKLTLAVLLPNHQHLRQIADLGPSAYSKRLLARQFWFAPQQQQCYVSQHHPNLKSCCTLLYYTIGGAFFFWTKFPPPGTAVQRPHSCRRSLERKLGSSCRLR